MMDNTPDQILKVLQEHFPQLAELELQKEIAQHGTLMQVAAGATLMNYGTYIRTVPLIISGSIKVLREDEREGREMLLYFLGPGETCSMSFTCCLMNKKSEIRTEAVDDSVLIAIPVREVDAWISRFQSWKNFVMGTYDRKMIELVRVLDSVVFEGMDVRLKKYLMARAESQGSAKLSLTHQEIATDLSASREAISRLLKKLENNGSIKLARNEVQLTNLSK